LSVVVICDIDTAEIRKALDGATWKIVKGSGRDYETFFPEIDLPWKVERAFFLKIPPGGKVHRHTDNPSVRYVIPVETNPKAITTVDGKDHHLEVGRVYQVDTTLEHRSANNGTTDRIHLLVDVSSAE